MSLTEALKNQFRLKLSPTLISQLLLMDVKPDAFIEFVAAQVQNIIACKPNCKIHTAPSKPVWVLRGYYPNTPVFFKLTVVKTTEHSGMHGNSYMPDFTYYVRARALEVKPRVKWRKTLNVQGGEIVIMSDDIMKNISEGLENSLLGASHDSKSLVIGGPSKPKCMSPKGMKLFRYKKPSNRKKREA